MSKKEAQEAIKCKLCGFEYPPIADSVNHGAAMDESIINGHLVSHYREALRYLRKVVQTTANGNGLCQLVDFDEKYKDWHL